MVNGCRSRSRGNRMQDAGVSVVYSAAQFSSIDVGREGYVEWVREVVGVPGMVRRNGVRAGRPTDRVKAMSMLGLESLSMLPSQVLLSFVLFVSVSRKF